MTLRERWLIACLALLGAALLGMFLWQQARFTDAEQAARRFARLDERLSRADDRARQQSGQQGRLLADPDDEARLALIRQAVPEIRHSLLTGGFRDAVRRMDSLDEEAAAGPNPEVTGTPVSVDALWPKGSPARARVAAVLKQLTDRQGQGYDMTPAEDALVDLAEHARAGKRDEALKDWERVEQAVKDARLRPGFGKPDAAEDGGRGEDAPTTGAVSEAQVQQLLQFFKVMLPQLIQQAPAEQQPLLRRLEPIGREFERAMQAGKDLSLPVRIATRLGNAYRRGDLARVDRLLDVLARALRDAPALPAGRKPPTAAPGGQVGQPAPGSGAQPATPGGRQPDDGLEQQLLQAMDGIRRMPEEAYQQQKVAIAAMVSRAIAARVGSVPGGEGSRDAPGVATASGLRLLVLPDGRLPGIRIGHENLSPGLAPGGFFLQGQDGREQPLPISVKRSGGGMALSAANTAGSLSATLAPVGEELKLSLVIKRAQAGMPGRLVVRIPLRATGWRWGTAPDAPVIAVDGTYAEQPDSSGLMPVVLRGGPMTLRVSAPSAATAAYDPVKGQVVVSLPVPGEAGSVKHEVRFGR